MGKQTEQIENDESLTWYEKENEAKVKELMLGYPFLINRGKNTQDITDGVIVVFPDTELRREIHAAYFHSRIETLKFNQEIIDSIDIFGAKLDGISVVLRKASGPDTIKTTMTLLGVDTTEEAEHFLNGLLADAKKAETALEFIGISEANKKYGLPQDVVSGLLRALGRYDNKIVHTIYVPMSPTYTFVLNVARFGDWHIEGKQL